MTAPNLLDLADLLDRQPSAIPGLHNAADALRWAHGRLDATAGSLTDDRIREIWNEVADRPVGGYLPFAREIERVTMTEVEIGRGMLRFALEYQKLIDALTAQIAELEKQIGVCPDGWQIVPKEPTPKMSAAGFAVAEAEHDPAGVYRAMIAAAPIDTRQSDGRIYAEASRRADPAGYEQRLQSLVDATQELGPEAYQMGLQDHIPDAGKMVPDHPDNDATDFAHPAWWRGHEHTVTVMCKMMQEILDGKPAHGTSSEPWQSLRVRLEGMAGAARFAGKVLSAHHDELAGISGDLLQDWAEQYDLIELHTATESCGSRCVCAEVGEFPHECYRLTPAGRAAIEAAKGGE